MPARHHDSEDMDLSRSKDTKEVAATTASGELRDKTDVHTKPDPQGTMQILSSGFAGTARESLGGKRSLCITKIRTSPRKP